MATSQIKTSNEGENEQQFDFNQWVNDNDLNSIKQLLINHQMNTVQTLRITSTKFQPFMSDPQFIANATIIPKFLSALNKVPHDIPQNDDDDNNNKSKIVRVVISEEEEKSTQKLNQYDENITSLIQQLNTTNTALTTNIKQIDSEIESAFNDLQQQIENKKHEMKDKLKYIEKEKRSEINAKSQKLDKEKNKVKNAIKSCNSLVEDINIERAERKKKIIIISQDITKNKVSNDITDIETHIHFIFNKDSISSFVENLCNVHGTSRHPIPVIDNLQFTDITKTEATVQFNAVLSNNDQHKEITSTLLMKVECGNKDIDEKEKEMINSSLITFNKNKNDYQHKLKSLTKNKNYIMNINLYESFNRDNNNKQITKRTDHKPISAQFKTSDNIDKHFVYQSDFDTNGVCYALGSNYGQKEWGNPMDQGLVTAASSGWQQGTINMVLSRTMQYSHTKNVPNAWISIDFKTLKVKPTAYTLRHDSNASDYLRGWDFDGSNNGNDWTTLKTHKNDTSLNGQGATHTWTIVNCNQSYKMFRIRMTTKNSSNGWYLECSGFEIYGHLTG